MKNLDPKAVWLFMFSRTLLIDVIIFIIVFSLILAITVNDEAESSGAVIFLLYLIALILAGLTSYIWAKLTYKYYRYELSRDAYHSEKGVVIKKYISIPYERIQNVDMNRGILSRILGLSDLDIQTAGRSTAGFSNEGRLPGIDKEEAVRLRDELIKMAKSAKSGL